MGRRRRLIVFLGPPGSGKGTQGRRWAEERQWRYVATGDLLREAVRRGTPLGQQAHAYMLRGELVPDEVMVGLMEELLTTAESDIVLDGYPRTLAQAQKLDELMERLGWQLHAVIYLQADEAELVARLSARRVCPSCQAVYNLRSAPPREDERCDLCGTTLAQRDDDRPEVIMRRLTVYQKETQPIVGYYAQKGLLKTVHASGTPEEVYQRLQQVME